MPTGRTTYEPPDDVHIFDGAEDDDDAEGSRLPLLIVIALFVLAAFGGVVWLAYTQGVARGRSDPRVIAAPAGPAKVAANDGTSQTPYKGLKIYQQPAPADDEADRQVVSPPAQPETTVITPPAQASAPPQTEASPPKNEAASVKPPPEIRTTTAVPPQTEASAPPAPLVKPVVKPAPSAAAPVAPASTGGYVLQIGAYKSQAEADAAWRSFQSKHAATLSGYAQSVKQVDLGGKGTWYRLRVGSFASKDAAAALCGKLTAEGGACFPAK